MPISAGQHGSEPLGGRAVDFISRGETMTDPSTKPELIEAMLAARAEFDSLLQRIPRSKMSPPPAQGEWSIKDIVAHINSYDRWLGLGLALRGLKPPASWIEDLPLDEFNHRLYEENRDLPLTEVLAQSQELWSHILEEVQAKAEDFLFSEQSVQGVTHPFRPCDILKSESYGHYLDHVPALKSWIEANR